MALPPDILVPFGLLAATIILLWVPVPAIRGVRCWAWGGCLALACGAGLAYGVLDWRALVAIALFIGLAWSASTASRTWTRGVLLVLAGLAALLLAVHRVPGFHNPVLFEGIRFSLDARPFTLYANFDKAVAAIVLMGVLCERIRTRAEWVAMLRRIGPVVLSTLVVVLGLGLVLGHVRPDVKWTPYSAWFLASNLFITCVAEEAFFRGLLLARLRNAMGNWRGGVPVVVAVSSVLFGLAHLGGGALLALLATIAGVLYALAYLRSGRVEGAILTHFALNAVHFVGFTYPALVVA